MIEYTDTEGRKRTAPNGRNQYLSIAVGMLPPNPRNNENWHLADVWSKDLAAKLITTGWCNNNLELDAEEVRTIPVGYKRRDAAESRIKVYEIFVRLADTAIAAGILKDPDCPAAWLGWAESKGYDLSHVLKYMGKPMSDSDAEMYSMLEDLLGPLLAPESEDDGPVETTGVKAENANRSWQEEARLEADQVHRESMALGYRLGNEEIASKVAERLAKRGIETSRGPLTGGNILREALQGNRWKRPKIPPGKPGENGKPGNQ